MHALAEKLWHIAAILPANVDSVPSPALKRVRNRRSLGSFLPASRTSISLERLDEFLAWVHKNLATAIPLSEVKTIYAQLITHIDDELMKDSAFWKIHCIPDLFHEQISR